MRNLTDQEIVRREKVAKIKELGIDPFGSRYDRTAYSEDLKEKYKDIPHFHPVQRSLYGLGKAVHAQAGRLEQEEL